MSWFQGLRGTRPFKPSPSKPNQNPPADSCAIEHYDDLRGWSFFLFFFKSADNFEIGHIIQSWFEVHFLFKQFLHKFVSSRITILKKQK